MKMGCRGSKPAQPPPPPPANGDDASPARGDGGGTRQGSTQDGVVERHVESNSAQREVSGASAYSTLSDEAATYAEMSVRSLRARSTSVAACSFPAARGKNVSLVSV